MPDEANGRVTMAVISTKLDTAISSLQRLETCYDLDHDVVLKLAGELGRVKDRQTVGAFVQGAISMALSAVAAWLGTRQ